MQIHVLGSGAGGGFPQWNCNCANCHGLRRGTTKATARTQSSIAVSSNEVDWVLVNASPDVRAQLAAFPAMQPARALRDTAICAVVLLDSQIDHTTGLLMLREHGEPLQIYCTGLVHEDLSSGFPVFRILEHYSGVEWHELPADEGLTFEIPVADGLRFTAVPLQSEAPPYSPRRHATQPGDNIGMRIEDTESGKVVFYAPGVGAVGPELLRYFETADCLLVDGTFWSEDEMIRRGVGKKHAAEMGHLPQSGDGGMISVLRSLERPRKILIHINNTNPILDEESAERAELTSVGIEVAYDGMEITL